MSREILDQLLAAAAQKADDAHAAEVEQRKREDALRNDRRFDRYNAARVNNGLPALSHSDYLDRKHGMTKLRKRIKELRGNDALGHGHRDNVVLLNR